MGKGGIIGDGEITRSLPDLTIRSHLSDMLKAKDGDFFISDWLRNRNTVEFLGIWEQVHNPAFNYGGFAAIERQAGLNNYKLSVKEWIAQTGNQSPTRDPQNWGRTHANSIQILGFPIRLLIAPTADGKLCAVDLDPFHMVYLKRRRINLQGVFAKVAVHGHL